MRDRSPASQIAAGIVLAVLYFLVARYAFTWDIAEPYATPLWPPSGLALAALLLWGRRLWPAILIAAFLAYATAGAGVVASIGIAAGSTVEAVLAAWLVGRFARGRDAFDRVSRTFAFAVLAGLLAPAIGALVAGAGLALGPGQPFTGIARIWLIRWLSHGGGILIVTPLLVLWANDRRVRLTRAGLLEAAAVILTLLALAQIAFDVPLDLGDGNPIDHAFYPLLAWTAFRMRPRATAAVMFGIAVAAVWGTVEGTGPFEVGEIERSLLMVHVFMIVTAASALTIAAAVTERRAAQAAVVRLNQEDNVLRSRLLDEEQRRRTDAEAAYQQAQEAVRVREDFLSIASHELRTPLTALRLQIQVLERSLAEELMRAAEGEATSADTMEKLARRAGALNDQSRRLTELVNGLFDVTGISAGKLELQLREADFREVVMSTLATFRLVAAEKRVPLNIEALEPLPGRWDPIRIGQVVTNLLSNAIKYGAGRPVDISVSGDSDKVTLEVCDRGPGIPPDYHTRIFDRFERVPGGDSPSGLGLGLYIARQIAEAHGGAISIESEPGCGAVFRLRLPRHSTPLSTEPERP